MDRHYIITIEGDNVQSNRSPIAGDNNQSDTAKSKGLLTKEGAKNFATFMVAYRTVKSFVNQIATHEVSMVSLRTGSNEMQERAQFTYEMIQKGIGVLEAVGTGALVGGLPGALVGLTLSAAHTVIGYAQNQDRINTQRTLENQSIQLNYIRAGARGSRGAI